MKEIKSGLDIRIEHLLSSLESITMDLELEKYQFPHPTVIDEKVKFADWYQENQFLMQSEPKFVAEHLLQSIEWLKAQLERIKFRCEEIGRIFPEVVVELQQEIDFLGAKLAETEKERDRLKTMVYAPTQMPQQSMQPIINGEQNKAPQIPPPMMTLQMTEELQQFANEMRTIFERGLAHINPKTGHNLPKHPSLVSSGMKIKYGLTEERRQIIDGLKEEYLKKYYEMKDAKAREEQERKEAKNKVAAEDEAADEPDMPPQTLLNKEEEEN